MIRTRLAPSWWFTSAVGLRPIKYPERMTTPSRREGASTRNLVSRIALALAVTVGLSACDAGPPHADGPDISSTLVGNNVWHIPSEAAWQVTGEAGLQFLRVGGIAYDNALAPNSLLDMWVQEAFDMGAEPQLQVSRFGTPEEAAKLVAHFNVDTDRPVVYWGIGNEPFCRVVTPESAAQVAEYWKPIAAAMKEVDPTIKIFGPNECDFYEDYYGELFSGDGSASDISGKVPGEDYYYTDGVAWHLYVGYPPEEIGIDALTTTGFQEYRSRIERTRALVDQANAANDRTGADALEWGIGEFNGRGGARVCSFENGQMIASVYGAIMEFGGSYGALWSIQESGGQCHGSDHGFLSLTLEPRPSYWHMQMVSHYFSGTYQAVASSTETVRAFGSVDRGDGRVTAMVMNIDTSSTLTCSIGLAEGAEASGTCGLAMPVGLDTTTDFDIGPSTTMVLVFDLDGALVSTVTYSADDNAPVVRSVS
ncbi:MAG: hypothetical protein CVT64_05955 [Actinobacteria bacterium HGW-Actinobacteria-4]|nr:MAG: hypothetical protein CVT64_05955 [Actinobacteria bacterium HGW-Actinobacteria-4]